MKILILILVIMWVIRVTAHLVDDRNPTSRDIFVVVLCAIGILLLCFAEVVS